MITSEQAYQLLAAIRAEKARRSLHDFIVESWHLTNPGTPFEAAWHFQVVADHVQRQLEEWATKRQDKRQPQLAQDLLINLPPRCGKSTIVSVCATAWAWLHWPDIKVGCLSTNPRTSIRDARAARELIRSDWYQYAFTPPWQIKDDQDALGSFANTAGGSRVARGFESKVVGEGFDWILIDDPHDPRDSTAAIQTVLDGWDSAVSSRVQDARCSIRTCIMQPITEVDFSSHVRAQGWGHLCLPMEREQWTVESPYGWSDSRTVGEVLAERFTPEVLAKRKLELGPYGYAAQYQMRPAPLEGGMIKPAWFRTFGMHELLVAGKRALDWVCLSVDATFGALKGDNVGLLVVGGKGPKRYVLEDASRPMGFLETVAAIVELLGRYPDARKILIEKSANGPAITEALERAIVEGSLRAVEIVELTTHLLGSKVSRATAMIPCLAAGLVHLLEGAAWVEAFKGEHGLFPNGAHDDRVDALSQCLAYYDESLADARKLELRNTAWKGVASHYRNRR